MSATPTSPLFRALLFAGIAAITGIALIVVVPIMLFAGVIVLVSAGVVAVWAWFAQARRPNGSLDGRRNVRVRTDDDPRP